MNLPSRLKDSRKLIGSLNFGEIEAAVQREARAQLAIIGPVNSGKSTLFNQLKGQRLSKVSAVPGTTTDAISERFGPFWLVDTPGLGEVGGHEREEAAYNALDHADIAVLVLDAMAGIRQSDIALLHDVKSMGIPVIIALNKIDLIKKDVQDVIRDAERKIGLPVIPISAKRGTNVAKQLIPAIIDSHPQMAVTIGRSLPQFRRQASQKVIRESAMLAALISAEPIPVIEIPLIIAVQVRMLLRLAAIYGETMSVARARELLSAIAGGLAIRYGTQEVVKLIPGPGWLIAAVTASTGTTALGNVATVFFDQKLTPQELRDLYKKVRWKRHLKLAEKAERDGNRTD